MLDRAAQLKILIASYRRALREVSYSLEALETGQPQSTSYSQLSRSFATMKHDADTLALRRLASFAASAQEIVERAADQKLGLPLDLLRAAASELWRAADTLEGGRRHELDADLMAQLVTAAKGGPVDDEPEVGARDKSPKRKPAKRSGKNSKRK